MTERLAKRMEDSEAADLGESSAPEHDSAHSGHRVHVAET